MDGAGARVSVVVPVREDAGTLRPLADRLAAALAGRDWHLRLVIDASTDESTAVAGALAAESPRIAVSGLTVSDGGDDALVRGLAAEPRADAWVCLDAGLRDPPEEVPAMLDRLERGDVGAVFAARPGGCPRPLLGLRHRLTGLPAGAGRFVAMVANVRDAVLAAVQDAGAPSVALAVTRSGAALATVPVPIGRPPAPRGLAGVRHSARSVAWAVRAQQR
ncbi:glycosyltransferase family 2 protein [Blastococcus litoris]|uniref:glycosyltransferase family 2 protein n=1 Tax=Blastococcus litoris TaxID=2171622 RepID=UPI000E305E22|nr:glycosyltransferase [Blastococcus litoris]